MKTIQTSNAPAAIGPYSQAKVVNGFVFASGQIPLNPATGEVEGTTIEGSGRAGDEKCRSDSERGRSRF